MSPALTHRPFGRTGLELPPIVCGATSLGNLFVAQPPAKKRELIREWFRRISPPVAIDTAGKYGAGLALEVLGRELAAAEIDPANVVISNKLGWRRVPLQAPEPTFEPGVWVDVHHDAIQEIGHDGILRCFRDGAEMLGPYRQALVSVHDPDEYLSAAKDSRDRSRRLDDIRNAYRGLQGLRDRGETCGVGVGAKDWRVIAEIDEICPLDWVMMANSLTIMNHPPELLAMVDSFAERNIAVINSAVTHGGFLVGGDYLDYRPLDPSNESDSRALRWRASFTEVCESCDADPYHVAVAFGSAHPAVSAVALSTSRPERVESLVRTVTEPPPPSVWPALRERGLIGDHVRFVP